MYLNGRSLLHLPLRERRKLLREHFRVRPGYFEFAESIETNEAKDIESFLKQSLKKGEGLMLKSLDDRSAYEPSKRLIIIKK